MVIFRLIGLLLIVLALMLLGADLVSTLEKNGETVIRSFDQILMLFGLDASLWVQQHVSPLRIVLFWPGWAVLGIPGIFLGMVSAGRREKKGYRHPPSSPPLPPINR